ncbi:MAG: T9SS type A sorting domain-containing protein, partial [Opitutaceae bacterium]|nr:T9SS type A sorting domain-containing protein [Cytophagales bacterium]
ESTPGGFGFNSIMPGGCVVIITPCTSFAEIQVKVTEEEVKKCKSYFDWSIDGDKIKLKSNTSGDNIGFARLDFGDGDWTETNGNLISTTHTYTQPGTYEICLKIATVSDSVLPYVRLAGYCSDTYCQSVVVGTKNKAVTGIESENSFNTSVSIYPNPAQDKVKFFVSKGTDNMTLRIYSSTGEIQKEVKSLANQDFELAIPELSNGIYIYSLSNASGSLTKGKLIVSK